jgi:hypothetical protein
MLEHLLRWIGDFDPLDELRSFVAGCAELSSTPSAPAWPRTSGWLLTKLRALIGLDTWTFYVDENSGWRGIEIERLLADQGVHIGSRGFAFGDMFFNIKLDQAEWAEYLMLRAGIPVKYGLHSTRNERLRRQAGTKKGTPS